MAKLSSIEKNKKRERLTAQYKNRRMALKKIINNKEISDEERFEAVLKLASMPRNGSRVRVRNRCELTGRPRGNYRKFKLSRIVLRDLANRGQIPGVVKASW